MTKEIKAMDIEQQLQSQATQVASARFDSTHQYLCSKYRMHERKSTMPHMTNLKILKNVISNIANESSGVSNKKFSNRLMERLPNTKITIHRSHAPSLQ